tara:strand:- start:541 stop:786 length:246 start_codon:yes stop_codon:yes gene_type:complete
MIGFIRKGFRPFLSIGQKIGRIFKIGRKAELVSDMRNLEKFENLAPSGLRQRGEKPSDMFGGNKGFYGNMDGYLQSFKYPT